MPTTDTILSEIARLKDTEAAIRKDIARAGADASKAKAEAAKKREAALKNRSPSTQRNYLGAAESEEKKAVAADKKLADLSKRAAQNSSAQAAKVKYLLAAEKSERQAIDRADDRRRQVQKNHAREIARIAQPTVRYVMIREPQPEKLRVLYLTANPEAIERRFENPDGSVLEENVWLRTEAEVRSVLNALRGSKYRHLIELAHRPAATFDDLLDGINDIRPHIVHFSGHAGAREILLDNGSVEAPEGRALPFSFLAETLAATDTPPTLLVLNACDTLDGSDVILPAVPIIIAMSDSISDAAAAVFATRFYAAIAGAQSVGASLRQAKVAMRTALFEDADLPQLSVRENVDIDHIVLVKANT